MQVISSKQVDEMIPKRSLFKVGRAVNANGEAPLFFATDVFDRDLFAVNGFRNYAVHIFGNLENGEKAHITLDGIKPYFDFDISIKFPNMRMRHVHQKDTEKSVEQRAIENSAVDEMRVILNNVDYKAKYGSVDITTSWSYPLHGFTQELHCHARLSFVSLYDRIECIKRLRESSLLRNDVLFNPDLTSHDDLASYYNIIARDMHFNAAGWNRLRGITSAHMTRDDDDTMWEVVMNASQYVAASAEDIARLMRDRAIVESWDIETSSAKKNGEIPQPGDDYTITTISLIYTYQWSDEVLASYVLSLYPSGTSDLSDKGIKLMNFDPTVVAGADTKLSTKSRNAIIVCEDERDMILTRAKIAKMMSPDIRMAFNGSNFDWCLYVDKMKRLRACNEIIPCFDILARKRDAADRRKPDYDESRAETNAAQFVKNKFRSINVKINAETTHVCSYIAQMSGTLDIDLQPCMRKIYPKEEVKFAASLKKYLEKEGLPPKNDIDFKHMELIFARSRELMRGCPVRKCHCITKSAPTNGAPESKHYPADCASCAAKHKEPLVAVLDCAIVDPSAPIHERRYYDGTRGTQVRYRDPAMETACCHCLHEIRRKHNLADVAMVNAYCGIDSLRPCQLSRKRNIIGDMRELSNTTYISLADSFFRADGMRVVNYVASFGDLFRIAVPCLAPSRPKTVYGGALVKKPLRGIHKRPVVALDFSSLYPSIIITMNLSPDTIIQSEEVARQLREQGYNVHDIGEFEYVIRTDDGPKTKVKDAAGTARTGRGWCIRHNNVLEPHASDGHGPKVTTYDDTGAPVQGRESLLREHMGLFGYVLRNILNARNLVKAQLKPLTVAKEKFEGKAEATVYFKNKDGSETAKVMPMSEVELLIAYYDSKQKALKILANTFYGQMGFSQSPCYNLVGAAGVTKIGQRNLRLVSDFLEKLGYTIVYGDTDSVYTIAPDEVYEAVDAKWLPIIGSLAIGSREYDQALHDYWGEQVLVAIADIEKTRVLVSDMLRKDNGTKFMNMAYEEAGFPAAFFGKKKYILHPHVGIVQWGAKPMLRGIDIVKQGVAPIVKQMGSDIVKRILEVRENKDLLDIVYQSIDSFYSSANADPSLFAQFYRYKPDKKNAAVHKFVDRMRNRYAMLMAAPEGSIRRELAALFAPPDAGDKFDCVIVVKDAEFEITGKRVAMSVGDRMEYLRAVQESMKNTNAEIRAEIAKIIGTHNGAPVEVDRMHYLNGSLMSLFARFASAHPSCLPENVAGDGRDDTKFADYTDYDEQCCKYAEQALARYCEKYNGEVNVAALRERGTRQRTVVGIIKDTLTKAVVSSGIAIGEEVVRVLFDADYGNLCSEWTGNGATITEELVKKVADCICSIAVGDKSIAARADELERIEQHADILRATNTIEALTEKYGNDPLSEYNRTIVPVLSTQRENAKMMIVRTVPNCIRLYRRLNLSETIAQLALEAVESGQKGRKQLAPLVLAKMQFNEKALEVFSVLAKSMRDYKVASANIALEYEMKKRFGI